MGRIKTRATLYAMGLVLLLITVFTVTIIQDKKRVLEEKTLSHRQLLKSSFELAMLDTQKGLNALAYKIVADRSVVDAFAARDRDRLYRLTLPYFNEAKIRGEIDLTAFIGADGFHFLRVHSPQQYGDNLTQKRPILAHAIQQKTSVSSIDVTLYNVALVYIVPVVRDGRFIGLLQVSADIKRVQQRLNTNAAIKSAIAFNTAKLKSLRPEAAKKSFEGFSFVSSNDPLFDHLPSDLTFSETKRYEIEGKDYIIASRPLLDYEDNTVAMMTCAFDVTEDITGYHDEIGKLLIFSLILITVMGIILHYGFNVLIQRIDKDTLTTRRLNEKLKRQLYTDFLTSLPNRNALLRDIEETPFHALLLLNIDNFKQINDFYGHKVGDGVLLAVARSLKEFLSNLPMNLYKMPSDEYAIALTEPMTVSRLDALRLSIVHHLQAKQYDLMGASIYVTLTMGMDILKENEEKPGNILANADMALKSAKKRHLHFLLYNDTMQIKEEYQNNIFWSKKVKEAIESQRFILHYQPIMNQDGKTVAEYEALVRMVENDGTFISPALFLPAAKQSHLYPRITQFVVDQVFEMLEQTPHTFSVNLSVDDIFHMPTSEFIFQKLRTSPYNDRIIFELLESEGIENYAEVSAFIAKVKGYGCKIAIDDFGTGYSNFAHILQLNVDILKIDGSLIRNLDTDDHARTIVSAITNFSQQLGVKTVAEFVHSESVLQACQELNIDCLQGFYLGEPAPL